jgi:hypothetical protein
MTASICEGDLKDYDSHEEALRSAFVKKFVAQAACIRDLSPYHPKESLSDNIGQDGDSQIHWSEGLGCPNDLGVGNEEKGERRSNHAGDGDYNSNDRYGDETESPRPAKRRRSPPSHGNSNLRVSTRILSLLRF